jgi:hypothetical protein
VAAQQGGSTSATVDGNSEGGDGTPNSEASNFSSTNKPRYVLNPPKKDPPGANESAQGNLSVVPPSVQQSANASAQGNLSVVPAEWAPPTAASTGVSGDSNLTQAKDNSDATT